MSMWCRELHRRLSHSSAISALSVLHLPQRQRFRRGAINLGAIASTLKVSSPEAASKIKKYHAIADRGKPTEKRVNSERSFCSECGTHLWVFDDTWPGLIHPFASCIDTELPISEEMVVLMMKSKASWVRLPEGKTKLYDEYPELSIDDWHKKHGVWVQ